MLTALIISSTNSINTVFYLKKKQKMQLLSEKIHTVNSCVNACYNNKLFT